MARTKVTVNAFEGALKLLLDEYGEDVADAMGEITPKVAKMGQQMLQEQSPRSGHSHSRRKAYADSWKVETKKTRLSSTSTIYNTVPGLPHLLEHGHLLRNGKRGGQRIHIAPVEEKVTEEFEKEVERRIKQG